MNSTLTARFPREQLQAWILPLGLSTLVLLSVSLVLNQWNADWQLVHQPITAVVIAKDTSNSDITALPNAHLFGQALTADGELPITNLQLRVTGISKVVNAAGNDASHATIVIGSETGKSYQVGDALPDGVKIYRIDTDSVILENEGRLEKLPMPRATLNFLTPRRGLFS